MIENTELIARLRGFEADHVPDGWPAIRMHEVSAPWLSEAHMLCTDQGIEQGNITERIRALRDKLGQPSQAVELSDSEILELKKGVTLS